MTGNTEEHIVEPFINRARELLFLSLEEPHELRKYRGNFQVAFVRLSRYYVPINEGNDRQLFTTILQFCQSGKGTLSDWDSLIELSSPRYRMTLEEYFSHKRAIKQRFEAHSPLWDAVCVALEPNLSQQSALLKKRWFTDWLVHEKPVLHELNIQHAFSETIEECKSTRIIEENTTDKATQSMRYQAIKSLLVENKAENTPLLRLLLGPRVFEAKARATQYFFTPEVMIFQQCYWILLSTAQQVFAENKIKGEEYAWLAVEQFHHQEPLSIFRLKALFMQMKQAYQHAFPHLEAHIQAFMDLLWDENTLKNDLFDSMTIIFHQMKNYSPEYTVFFMPATGNQDTEEREYTQDNIERKAIALEKERYYDESLSFLTETSEEIMAKIANFLHLEPLSHDVLHSARARKAQRLKCAEILANLLTHLPSSRENDAEPWLLYPAMQNSDVADLFLSHGATFIKCQLALLITTTNFAEFLAPNYLFCF